MKLLLKIVMGLAVLVIALIIFIVATFDVNQYKGQIIEVVQEKTQRSFSIDGELGLGVSLIPTVFVEGVKFGNSDWGSKPDMLSVGKFEIQVALLPLLNKNIEVKRLILNNAEILLEKNKQGKANWELELAETEEKPAEKSDAQPTDLPALDINEIKINDAKLVYLDKQTDTTQNVTINEISIETGGFNKPLDIAIDVLYNELPILVSGTSGSLANLSENKDFALDIKTEIQDIKAEIKGGVAKPKDMEGLNASMSVSMDSLKSLSAFSKQEVPDVGPIKLSANITEKEGVHIIESLIAEIDKLSVSADGKISDLKNGKGINLSINLNVPFLSDLNSLAGSELPKLGPLSFSGTVSDTKTGYAVKSMTAQILEYNLTGDLEASLSGPRPKLVAKLASDKLDLSPFQGEEKEEVKKEKVFPSDPLPFEGLKTADADITFTTKSLITKSLTVNDVNLNLNLDNGKLKISQQGKAAGGTISANINLDASNGKTASIDNKIQIKQIELGQIPAIKEKEVLTGGKTNITINAKGSGSSVAAIMAGLNGDLLIKTGQGKISSKALDVASADAIMSTLSLLNPGASKSDGNSLECAVVNFKIKDGIATADNGIGLTTNQLNVIGGGSVNLKTEELDIGITPKAREGIGLNLGQLAGLVRVGGTLANPSPKADAGAALKKGLEVGTAVATGGLSLLAGGLLDSSDGEDAKPCDIALGIAPKKKPKTAEKSSEEKGAVEKTTDTVKDAAGAIGDKLKSLF